MNRVKSFFVLFLVIGSIFPATFASATTTEGFKYKIETVYYSQSDVSDYTAYFDINTAELKDTLSTDWTDKIMVVDESTGAEVPHYVESIGSGTYRLWFKDNFKAGNNYITIYLDGDVIKPNDAEDIFLFYDNFSTLKTEWDVSNINYSINDSITLINTEAYYKDMILNKTFNSEVEIDAKYKLNDTNTVFAVITDATNRIANLSNQLNGTYSAISTSKFSILKPEFVNNGINTYPYWIEDSNGQYTIWTKISIPVNSEKVIYVQKIDGYSPNGDAVFDFFDNNEITVGENQVSHTLPFNVMNYIVEFSAKYNNDGGYVGLTPNTGNYQGANLYLYTSNIQTYDGSYHTILSNPTYPIRASIKLGETQPTYTITDANGNSNTITTNYRGGVPSEIDTVWCGYTSYATWSYTIYWFAVRKYAEQEPTISVSKINDNTWKVTITNPNSYDLNGFQVKIPGDGIVNSKTDSIFVGEGSGYLLKTLNSSTTQLNTNTYYTMNVIDTQNEVISKTNAVTIKANTTQTGKIALAVKGGQATIDEIKIRKHVNTPPVLVSSTLPYLIGTSSDIIVTKKIAFYDEADTTAEFYANLSGTDLYGNITLVATGNSSIREYKLSESNFTTSSIELEIPTSGTLVVSDDRGFVRKIIYEDNEVVINFTYPNKDQTLVEWFIRVESASDLVQVKDSRDNVLYESTGSDTHSFFGIFGRNYKIYVNGMLKATDTASTAKTFDFTTNPFLNQNTTTVADVVNYTRQDIPTATFCELSGYNENGTLYLEYQVDGAFNNLSITVYNSTNAVIYQNTFNTQNGTITLQSNDTNTHFVVAMLYTSESKKVYTTYLLPKSPSVGQLTMLKDMLGKWKYIIGVLALFIVIVAFSAVHEIASAFAIITTLAVLTYTGYLDFLNEITKAMLFALCIIPLIFKAKRGW